MNKLKSRHTLMLMSTSLLVFGLLSPQTVSAQAELACENDIIVKAGDSLAKIARTVYGDPALYRALVSATNAKAKTDASYAAITNLNIIRVGWKLCAPSLEDAKAMTGTSARASATPAASPAPAAAAAATPATPATPAAVGQSNSPRLRALNFSPFDSALSGLTPARAAAIDTIVVDATVPQVQAALAAGELTSEELTLYFLSRIKRYDETLRTFVELNPQALAEARASDARRKDGKLLGPLDGIPVSLKDNIETAAPLHTTGGAEILLNHVPSADAPLVKNLRAAGVVILGKANLSELAGAIALLPPGSSAVGGLTMNPHGDFSAGGSSSGSGAGTAAYLTMVSVGSETAGSLIVPASWNGVVGMYPSKGVVEGRGVIPLVKNNDSAGPIGRSVSDVAILLGAMNTKNVDYAGGLDAKALAGVKAGFLKTDVLSHTTNVLEDTADNAAIAQRIEKGLTDAGAVVNPIELTDIVKQIDQLMGVLLTGGVRHDTLPYLTAAGAPVKTPEELSAYNKADPKRRIPFGQVELDQVLAIPALNDPAKYQSAISDTRTAASESLDAALAENDILVSVNNYHSALYATANYPAISVPLGLRANGMPVGVVFIARPGDEAKLLAYAYAFEQATQARVNPTLK